MILIPVFTYKVTGLKEAFGHWWFFTCCLKMESLTLLDVDNSLVFTHTHKWLSRGKIKEMFLNFLSVMDASFLAPFVNRSYILGPYLTEFIIDLTDLKPSSLGNVYLPNNLLCATTSSCMQCITHVFTMISTRGRFSKECYFYWSRFFLSRFWRGIKL